MTQRFVFPGAGLSFSHPLAVWRAHDAAALYGALQRVQQTVAGGAFVAGYITYEGAATFAAFDAPQPVPQPAGAAASLSPLIPRIGFGHYQDCIGRIQRAIGDGDVYQVNYTVAFDAILHGDAYALWHSIGETTGAAYRAFVVDGERCIASWSPELFLRFEADRRIVTRPMKGTATLDNLAALDDPKNRAEHIMIVDLLRNDLRRVCDDATVRELCTVERYPSFATMTSTIEGRMRDGVGIADVFAAVFPCGSITGAPKRAAMQAIARAEARERGVYCGSIGFFRPDGSGWWNVAIRTADIDGERVHFGAGGGIVTDSTAQDEWDELHLKAAFLQQHTDPFDVWETFAGDAPDSVRMAHLQRLRATARDLGIRFDDAAIGALFERGAHELVRVRLRSDGTSYAMRDALQTPHDACVIISDARVRSADTRLRYKTSNRREHAAAAAEAALGGAFDALLLNERGAVTEGSRTNVFVERDGVLLTPPLSDGVLPGILRESLLASGRAREATLYPDDLAGGALFVGNSARGLIAVELNRR